VAIVVGDVFVGGVVAAFIGHLTGADAPGAAVLDHIVEAVAAHVLLQGGGAVDIGGALAPGEADEVFGGVRAEGEEAQAGGDGQGVQLVHHVTPLQEGGNVYPCNPARRPLNGT